MIQNASSNVLRDPSPSEGGGGSTLSPEQQKIAAAIDKSNAATPAADQPVAKTQPKVGKPLVTAPPKEVLETSFDTNDAPEDIDVQPIVKVEAAPIKKEEKAVEKKEEAPVVKSTTTVDVKVAAGKAVTKTGEEARDYTGFTPEEQAILKQMSNPAFQYAAKNAREYKALVAQKGTPDTYLQHPEAYSITPEYREASQKVHFATAEQNHWREQLIAIRNGKDWYGLQGYDDKGKPVLSGPNKATDGAEVDVSNALNMLTQKVTEFSGQRDNYAAQFRTRYDTDSAAMKAELAKRFEWVAKPEMLDDKIQLQGIGEVTLKQIQNDFRNIFPAYHHKSPLMDVASNLFIALQIFGTKINELETKLQTEGKLKDDVIRAEPVITGDGSGAAATERAKGLVFDTEGMD